MRAPFSVVIVLALTCGTGPVSLADVFAEMRSTPRSRAAGLAWPGASVKEVRHGPGDLSLFARGTRGDVEVRMIGDQHDVELWITAGRQTRRLGYRSLIESRGMSKQALRRWLERTVGDAVRVNEADRSFLERTLHDEGMAKSTCAGRTRAALAGAAAWLGCIATAAATGGTVLPYCFVIGAGAYFLAYAAIEACNPGGNDRWDCNCLGIAPDCMCCDVEPGKACTCYCPGEECCDWDDEPDPPG